MVPYLFENRCRFCGPIEGRIVIGSAGAERKRIEAFTQERI
jgi:hypothetical protein